MRRNFIKAIFFSAAIMAAANTFAQKKQAAQTVKIENPAAGQQTYKVSLGNTVMAIDAREGARITSFTLGGKEIIGPGGSTFWTSPQDPWGWPPIPEHHDKAYKVTATKNSVEFTSEKDAKLGVVIKKNITANPSDSSFVVTYTISNESGKELKVAPWENTRTKKSSITFYPRGEKEFEQSSPVMSVLKMNDIDGIRWFAYSPERVTDGNMAKLYADGSEGWIANTDEGLLLVKKFEDTKASERAPGEGEIEIFADTQNPFIEMEQQGAYQALAPGAKLTWQVKWYLRSLPGSVTKEEGNAELVKIVRSIVKK
ncbi:MAG: DUF4380 domain-containing protein [Sporocytophaga sp.]|nr:DUF4380 domain-containing protein [Sporocytophaga sp.]